MKTIQNHGGKPSQPAVVLLLALLLALALGAVWVSWRLSHRPRSVPTGLDYTARYAALTRDADRLMQAVQSRVQPDKAPFEFDKVQARQAEVAVAIRAAAPTPTTNVAACEITFHLRGIARHNTHPVAFIDERTVEVGEQINGFKVIGIDDDSATFLDPSGRKRVVRLYDE